MIAPWQQDVFSRLLVGRGHAWLLASSGGGRGGGGQTAQLQFEMSLSAAAAWLCEASAISLSEQKASKAIPQAACGVCASCKLVEAKTHPDLRLLLPEVDALALGTALDEKSQKEIDDKKRKPSKEIRVEAVRELVAFAQSTSARGRGLVVVVFPAERMNAVSANAMLKTLEEPAGHSRFLLVSSDASALLPTIRSRCQLLTVRVPDEALSSELSNLPTQIASGLTPAQLPQSLRELPALVAALQQVCHDAMCTAVGGQTRFFKADAFGPRKPNIKRLIGWSKNLNQHAKNAEHTFNAALMQEALMAEATAALR